MTYESSEVSILCTWVEPAIERLDLVDTQQIRTRGGDGGKFIDCTRS